MIDFFFVGPIVAVLILIDVGLHLYLDFKKVTASGASRFQEPSHNVPRSAMAALIVSTFLSFFLVSILPITWMIGGDQFLIQALIPLVDPPLIIWISGLIFLAIGIIIHGWSRYVRQEMAASWVMRESHKLITDGPYARVRHPSYTSYFFCFAGLILMLPSLVSLVLLVGFPGYYSAAKTEEELLLTQFGDEYRDYMMKSGRFLPSVRRV
ncbi:MAG: isoprenylcysteine carboxylmethyltransferase family protein [Candidatus Thorarchaeota archaeon]